MKKITFLALFITILSANQMPQKKEANTEKTPTTSQKASVSKAKTYLGKDQQQKDRLGNGPFYLKSMFPLCPLTIGLNLIDNSMYLQGIEFGTCGLFNEIAFYHLFRNNNFKNCVFSGWRISTGMLGTECQYFSICRSWSARMYKNWNFELNLGFTFTDVIFIPFLPVSPSMIGIRYQF